jgi:hypothetical protein
VKFTRYQKAILFDQLNRGQKSKSSITSGLAFCKALIKNPRRLILGKLNPGHKKSRHGAGFRVRFILIPNWTSEGFLWPEES